MRVNDIDDRLALFLAGLVISYNVSKVLVLTCDGDEVAALLDVLGLHLKHSAVI